MFLLVRQSTLSQPSFHRGRLKKVESRVNLHSSKCYLRKYLIYIYIHNILFKYFIRGGLFIDFGAFPKKKQRKRGWSTFFNLLPFFELKSLIINVHRRLKIKSTFNLFLNHRVTHIYGIEWGIFPHKSGVSKFFEFLLSTT